MSLTLNLHYLTRQLKFVFLFVIWSYCLLRISHNTISTAWVSLSEGFFHPDGLTKWWFYINMMPGWWIMHLVIIIYVPLLLNNKFKSILRRKHHKILNYYLWIIIMPILVIFFQIIIFYWLQFLFLRRKNCNKQRHSQ